MLQWIVYVLIVTLILSAAALSAERALRFRRRSTRWVWVATIVASLVLPTIIASVSIQLPQITASNTPQKALIFREVTSLPLTALSEISMPQAGADLDTRLKRAWWIASGALLFLLACSAVQLFWRKRRWSRATVAGVSVYVAPDTGPAVVGLIRPCIVVPAWVSESSPASQALVIAHENAHLAARDPLLLTAALCLLVFMPWNLPLWWQAHRLRRAIEVDCDARVLGAGHDVTRYGETLIEVGQRQSAYLGTVAAMSESTSFLEQRLRIMLTKPGRWWKTPAALLGCASVCLVAVAAQVTPPDSGQSASPAPEVVTVDTAVYDGYVGHYRFGESSVMTISREGNRLLSRLTGQPPVEIFPNSKTEYFAKIVNAQITFEVDAQGRATAITLHQNGKHHAAPRMDDQAAQQIEDALNARVQSQTPLPGSEAAVRRLYGSLLSGKPIYDEMSPGLAEATREQLPQLLQCAQNYGAIRSIEFRGVGPQGMDVYDVHHEKGRSTMRIALSPDGKIQGALFSPGP